MKPDVAAARDAEVGVAGLPRPVDRAAEHRNLEVLLVGAEPLLDLLGERLHADVVAAAARAGDHHRPALAQAERLQDLPGDLDLLDRIGREARRASCRRSRRRGGVPMPTALLIAPLEGGPASVTPRCSG